MTTTQSLAASFELTRGVLVGLTPDHYGLPTPCASWDVRDLANHIVRAANWFAPCVNTGAAPEPDPTIGFDYAIGDLVDAFDQGAAASLAAFSAPGALERIVRVHFGPLPGAVILVLASRPSGPPCPRRPGRRSPTGSPPFSAARSDGRRRSMNSLPIGLWPGAGGVRTR